MKISSKMAFENFKNFILFHETFKTKFSTHISSEGRCLVWTTAAATSVVSWWASRMKTVIENDIIWQDQGCVRCAWQNIIQLCLYIRDPTDLIWCTSSAGGDDRWHVHVSELTRITQMSVAVQGQPDNRSVKSDTMLHLAGRIKKSVQMGGCVNVVIF